MKRILAILLLLFAGLTLGAQEVQLNEDPAVAQLTRAWTNQNRVNPRIQGWRVQLMSSTDRQQVEEARNRFRNLFPDIPAEWIHEKPYYKLRVGAFRTRMEALAFISTTIEDIYTGAYPARDANINPRDFLE
jgi:hypothetical protein